MMAIVEREMRNFSRSPALMARVDDYAAGTVDYFWQRIWRKN